MAEVDAPPSGNDGRVGNPSAHQDIPTTSRSAGPGNATPMVVQLGAEGSIPMKVPAGQAPGNQTSSQQPRQPPGQNSQPSRSRQQAPAAQTVAPPKEKIYLSKESMAMV